MSEKDNANLSPAQASFVYWFNGLFPIVTNVVTTLMVYRTAQKKAISDLSRYNQQVNEVSRQFVSGTIGLISYFGGGEMTRAVLDHMTGKKNNNNKMTNGQKQVAMIVGAGLGSFFGFAVLRPWFSTTLVSQFQKESLIGELSLKKKEIFNALNRAVKKGTDTLRLTEAQKEIDASLKLQAVTDAAKAKGKYSVNKFGRYCQEWVDNNLFVNDHPQLKKAAVYASIGLTGYLSVLTGLMWGLHHLVSLSEKKNQALNKEETVPTRAGLSAVSQSPALTGVATFVRPPAGYVMMPPVVYPTQMGVFPR